VTRNYFQVPTECPECHTKLERDGEYLVCRGEECPAQIVGAIERWIKKIGVLHFGRALIEALVDADLVEDIADLYTADPDTAAALYMGERRVGGTASKAFKNLHAKRELDLHVFVGALGIPLIGRSMAKMLVDGGLDSLDKMYQTDVAAVANIPGVGQTKATSFCTGYWNRMGLIAKLLGAGVTIKKVVDGPLSGKTFCLTGFRDPALQDALEGAGGVVKGVSKKLDYLVLQDPSSTSGKAKKARSYNDKGQANIALIGIDDAWALVK